MLTISPLAIPEAKILFIAFNLGDVTISLEACPMCLIVATAFTLGLGTIWTSVTGCAFIFATVYNLFVPIDSTETRLACLILLSKAFPLDNTCPLAIDCG